MSWCETEMQKYMPLVKQNVMKFEVFILGEQRIDQKRNKGWWRGSRERIEMEAQKVTELTLEEEDKEHLQFFIYTDRPDYITLLACARG